MNLKKNIVIVGSIIFLVIIGILLLGGNKGNAKKLEEGYTEIREIEGAVFHMNQKLLDISTSIVKIANDSKLDGNTFYVYKNGVDQYILFNMKKIVVLVEKGTNFNFHTAENLEEALENANVCNIWFEKSGKKLEIENSGNAYYADVNAQITITKELYGDFTGKLTTVISDNGTEYSIFVGVPGTNPSHISSADKEIVESIALSLYTIDSEGVSFDKETETLDAVQEDAVQEESVERKETEEKIAAKEELETIENAEQTGEEIEEAIPEEDHIEVIESTQEVPEEEPKNDTEQIIEEPIQEVIENNTVNVNNQKEKEKVGEIYKSDIYSMLDLKEEGLLTVYNEETREYEEISIMLEEVYTGKKATEMIKRNLKDYSYFEPKEGTHYHVVTYSINYEKSQGKPYVNIKLRGLDGEVLKYMGIKYSKKTHDLDAAAKQNGDKITNMMCFYEVPNGCKEYVLECGEGTTKNKEELMSAYYKIEVE